VKNLKFYIGCLVILVLGVVAILAYSSNTSIQQEKRKELDGVQVNNQFVDKFFNYTTSSQRYENIKPFMTEQGYRSTYPSGMEVPTDESTSVKSFVNSLKSYVQKEPESNSGHLEIINEFELTTEFNNVQSSRTFIMKTSLIYDDSVGWKVNDVDMIM